MGLSSLGRSEPYVLATIEAVLSLLALMTDQPTPVPRASTALTEGHDLLELNNSILTRMHDHQDKNAACYADCARGNRLRNDARYTDEIAQVLDARVEDR